MKKILIIGAFLALCGTASATDVKSYKLDNVSIDAIISNAVEVSPSAVATDEINSLSLANTATLRSDKDPWVAWVICWAVGEFGVHRHYLGTKSSMWAIYTFTCCGIFGIVPLVDWVVLLVGAINDDIRKYENNTKFFMW